MLGWTETSFLLLESNDQTCTHLSRVPVAIQVVILSDISRARLKISHLLQFRPSRLLWIITNFSVDLNCFSKSDTICYDFYLTTSHSRHVSLCHAEVLVLWQHLVMMSFLFLYYDLLWYHFHHYDSSMTHSFFMTYLYYY